MTSTGAIPKRISSFPLAKRKLQNAERKHSSRSFSKPPIGVVGSLASSALLGVCCLLVLRCMRTARMRAAEDRASSQSISVKTDYSMPRAVGHACVLFENHRNFETDLIDLSTPQPLASKHKGLFRHFKPSSVGTDKYKNTLYKFLIPMLVIGVPLAALGVIYLLLHIGIVSAAFSALTAALLAVGFVTIVPAGFICKKIQ
eukprot:GHVT01024033.1.p2 GENE.GHVT01024033.1~~GHVT01024033.1.p2  ORF type:complete len:201 (+),score=7.23 GHVT01024033.1:1342-1944(+)